MRADIGEIVERQLQAPEDLVQRVVALHDHLDGIDEAFAGCPERRFTSLAELEDALMATWVGSVAHAKVGRSMQAQTRHNSAADQLPAPERNH